MVPQIIHLSIAFFSSPLPTWSALHSQMTSHCRGLFPLPVSIDSLKSMIFQFLPAIILHWYWMARTFPNNIPYYSMHLNSTHCMNLPILPACSDLCLRNHLCFNMQILDRLYQPVVFLFVHLRDSKII